MRRAGNAPDMQLQVFAAAVSRKKGKYRELFFKIAVGTKSGSFAALFLISLGFRGLCPGCKASSLL